MSDDHPTHDYPRAVVDGRVTVGKWVRLACERHLHDLAHGRERGLWFDPKAADVALRFFGLLKFTKGKWGGKAFTPEPWQRFLIGSAFGWKNADATRRFREIHVEVARKNGKTETAAGVALKLLAADGEAWAEVYCLATKKDQARTTFDIAKRMAMGDALKGHLRRLKGEVRHEASWSKLEPLGADADSLDSLNVHGAIKDELHAWKSRELWDVIDTATGARSQPMGLSTTTAGFNRRSIWWERREACLKLLDGTAGFENDELFPLVFTLDEGDDWQDPATWPKGNPNLGVTVRPDELAKRCKEAQQTPAGVNAYRRLRLNQPTETATRWLNMALWRAAAEPVAEEALHGRPCFGGLDLSLTTDLTAFALWFPPAAGDPVWRLLVRHWMPGDDLETKESRDRVPYRRWSQAEGSSLALSNGGWVDYEQIFRRVYADSQRFKLIGVAFDRHFSPPLVQRLMVEGVRCVPWGQGWVGLNTGTKEFNRLLIAREVRHQGCPLLEWQAENTAVSQDPAGNLKPDKAKATQRIDGVAASITGLSLAVEEHLAAPPEAGIMELDFEPF